MKNKKPDFKYEKSLWKRGYYVIGVDEVGRGALAGPVYAGAVCFDNIFSDSARSFLPASARTSDRLEKFSALAGSLLLLSPEKKEISVQAISSGNIFSLKDVYKFIKKLGINDSKKLSSAKREKLMKIIKDISLAYATGYESNKIINKIGIVKATQRAMRQAIHKLKVKINKKKIYVLIDAYYIKYLKGIGLKNQKAIIKGDEKSISIAAASIITKV